jgi:hypothetical protein
VVANSDSPVGMAIIQAGTVQIMAALLLHKTIVEMEEIVVVVVETINLAPPQLQPNGAIQLVVRALLNNEHRAGGGGDVGDLLIFPYDDSS